MKNLLEIVWKPTTTHYQPVMEAHARGTDSTECARLIRYSLFSIISTFAMTPTFTLGAQTLRSSSIHYPFIPFFFCGTIIHLSLYVRVARKTIRRRKGSVDRLDSRGGARIWPLPSNQVQDEKHSWWFGFLIVTLSLQFTCIVWASLQKKYRLTV